jgi:hypothetical protein
MNRGEAYLVLFWRDFFLGRRPPPVSRLPGLGEEALGVLERGLARAVVRYLIAHGGGAAGVSICDGERVSDRTLWSAPAVRLSFTKPVLALLLSIASGTPLSAASSDYLGSGGELLALMIADELEARPQEEMDRDQVAARGHLASLVFAAPLPEAPWPEDDSLDDVLFFARGRIASGWLAYSAFLDNERTKLDDVLTLADDCAARWGRYRDHAVSRGRYDLLAPMCEAARFAFDSADAEGIAARVRGLGEFASETERQRVFRRVRAGYGWLEDLADLGVAARRTHRYDPAFGTMQVYLNYYGRVPERVRAETTRLADSLGDRI